LDTNITMVAECNAHSKFKILRVWKNYYLSILCFVDRAYLYNLVNKANLVHNLLLVCLYSSISTCFGRLWAHQQEKQLCLCDTWYLLFWVDDCLVCRVDKHSCFSCWWAHSHPKHVEIDKYKHTNRLCTKLVLFTRFYLSVVQLLLKLLGIINNNALKFLNFFSPHFCWPVLQNLFLGW
jgi:hypothetical protein